MSEDKYPINLEWKEYYMVLEGIRRTGVTNMYGAAPYLKEFCPELSLAQASEILCNWMHNYNELVRLAIIDRK